jgi:hypothetical protein
MDIAGIGTRRERSRALTRLAALGTLSRNAGEGGYSPEGWVGEGDPGAQFFFDRHQLILAIQPARLKPHYEKREQEGERTPRTASLHNGPARAWR